MTAVNQFAFRYVD